MLRIHAVVMTALFIRSIGASAPAQEFKKFQQWRGHPHRYGRSVTTGKFSEPLLSVDCDQEERECTVILVLSLPCKEGEVTQLNISVPNVSIRESWSAVCTFKTIVDHWWRYDAQEVVKATNTIMRGGLADATLFVSSPTNAPLASFSLKGASDALWYVREKIN